MNVMTGERPLAGSGESADPAAREVIVTRGLVKRFNDVTALDHVDICIRSGEFVAVMGPSGCGKTTLLNIISCLDTPTTGTYVLEGIDTARLTEQERAVIRRERIGLVFQQFHLIPYLTALENVMLAQYYHSIADHAEALEGLRKVGLAERADHLPSQLSGGEQQRVCIVRALINDPAIVLADEPTGNLDAHNEALVLALLSSLHADGRTIVLITHNPALAEVADRVIRLDHGRIQPCGGP